MIRLAYSLLVIVTLGLLLFGLVVAVAFAVQYYGFNFGLTGFITSICYALVVLPVLVGLIYLGSKIK